MYSPGLPGTHYAAQDGFKLAVILLLQMAGLWDCSGATIPRSSNSLKKVSTSYHLKQCLAVFLYITLVVERFFSFLIPNTTYSNPMIGDQ